MNVSVVIATADRPTALEGTLRSLSACEPPTPGTSTIHVIVADNGIDPGTRRVSETDYTALRIEYLHVDRRGKTVAQNRAVEATDADFLVFTDDDVEFDPRWLAELTRAAREWPENLLFGGRVLPIWPKGRPKHLADSSYLGLLFTRLDRGDEERPIPDFRPLGPNMAVRREAFDRGVRFDETIGPGSGGLPMGDELDITFQLEALGQTAVYVPRSRVYHRVRESQLSLRWQWKRGVDYGRMTGHFDRDADVHRMLGVPRWVLRAIPIRCAEAGWNFLLGRRERAFDASMQVAFAVGRARGSRQSGTRSPPKGTSETERHS